jgi:hypothetical protein
MIKPHADATCHMQDMPHATDAVTPHAVLPHAGYATRWPRHTRRHATCHMPHHMPHAACHATCHIATSPHAITPYAGLTPHVMAMSRRTCTATLHAVHARHMPHAMMPHCHTPLRHMSQLHAHAVRHMPHATCHMP